MPYLFLHGLGQTPAAWQDTLAYLNSCDDICCPDLAEFLTQKPGQWNNLYTSFCQYAQQFRTPLHLCGLSLGAVLALQYAAEYPRNVQSLVLIAPQYKMPKALLRFQSALFRLMPAASFRDTGLQKEDFLSLTSSMIDIDLTENLDKINCPVLVLCGEKDKANRRTGQQLSELLPYGKFLTIPNAGHELTVDAPHILGAQLTTFYRSL